MTKLINTIRNAVSTVRRSKYHDSLAGTILPVCAKKQLKLKKVIVPVGKSPISISKIVNDEKEAMVRKSQIQTVITYILNSCTAFDIESRCWPTFDERKHILAVYAKIDDIKYVLDVVVIDKDPQFKQLFLIEHMINTILTRFKLSLKSLKRGKLDITEESYSIQLSKKNLNSLFFSQNSRLMNAQVI
uniref:Uncharacterized protein n=1 Tax=Rhabditophanes sp. KR3021 TaxID=114890 RepID=A0AC35TTL4_9BILA